MLNNLINMLAVEKTRIEFKPIKKAPIGTLSFRLIGFYLTIMNLSTETKFPVLPKPVPSFLYQLPCSPTTVTVML